jgi:hypothetical protein
VLVLGFRKLDLAALEEVCRCLELKQMYFLQCLYFDICLATRWHCILAFELEYTLHDAGDCDLQSVYISAQYGAVLNMELEAILDEFMLL